MTPRTSFGSILMMGLISAAGMATGAKIETPVAPDPPKVKPKARPQRYRSHPSGKNGGLNEREREWRERERNRQALGVKSDDA